MPRHTLAILAMTLFSLAALAQNLAERHFSFRYVFTVKNVPAGQPMRVWIPMAHSGDAQTVRVVSQSGDLPLRKTQEPEFGNWILYAETSKADKSEYHFSVEYDVVRREEQVLVLDHPVPAARARRSHVELTRFLQADRLVPITGTPAQIAAEQTRGATTQLEKARDLYDYVFRTMKYDKTGTGWGHGDVLWACDSKRGNCTDFHSLFISMARSQQIPARFEIGFPLPSDKSSADAAGYHCWADFFVDSIGWIPVDISEAWKHPELHDYYFGQRDPNRIQFTVGRDLTLNPRQTGPPLNYFVYPYVEVSGREYSNIDIAFSFENAKPAVTPTTAKR